MNNIPEVKLGIVAVSRDCFPIRLSESRRKAVVQSLEAEGQPIFEAKTTVESETDMCKALEEIRGAGVNALVVYLGNFGPETAETLLAKYFDGPVMFVAAAEEKGSGMIVDRGDAYCGLLNASYNLHLRNIGAYIPQKPVGLPGDIARRIVEFVPIARALLGLRGLKIISFGPRPQDFMACNAPIKQLFNMGVEIQENSELDLYESFLKHAGDSRIEAVAEDMAKELGKGNNMPEILPKLAQYELTLLDWAEANKGSRQFVVFANKCWPAFQTMFGFVPCYVNSRLASRGYPVACEVDIYGALSEYIGACVTEDSVTILDVNNTVPPDIYTEHIQKLGYKHDDTFMGFHCGNTPACKLKDGEMRFQRIMHSALEPDKEPDITRGTLEGDIAAGKMTLYRLQGTADGRLVSYVAQGEFLDVGTQSFGAIGIVAIPEMGRFYRNVLVEDGYPHHAAVVFRHSGQALFEVMRFLGAEKVSFNQPAGMYYPGENPFCG